MPTSRLRDRRSNGTVPVLAQKGRLVSARRCAPYASPVQ